MHLAEEFSDGVLLLVLVFCFGVKGQDHFDLGLNTIDNEISAPDNPTYHTYNSNIFANNLKYYLECPAKRNDDNFFTFPCQTEKDCNWFDKQLVCCDNRCQKGIPSVINYRPQHQPTFFGLVDRECPSESTAELFPIKKCISDEECFPRICCSEEKGLNAENYCRTAVPKFDRLPMVDRFLKPLKPLMSYMQCTPPPPPFLDFFPKPCKTQFDCFPNLCCQERGRKYCRPAKKSIIGLMATLSQIIRGDEELHQQDCSVEPLTATARIIFLAGAGIVLKLLQKMVETCLMNVS